MTDFTIRPANAADHESISSWTSGTFSWGDYVGDAFIDWLEDEDGTVIVAEVGGNSVSLGRIRMVSESKAWSNAMRVHPDYRRAGIGSAVGDAMSKWARGAGARVIRLAVEDWNEPARNQVVKAGFRSLGDWLWAQRGVGDSSPVPEGNGGMRMKGYEALRPAHSAEAEPALLSWSGGELARAAHGLFGTGWTWQRLTKAHLVHAAKHRMLWEGRPGWAYAESDGDLFSVHWLETTPEDARAMVRALVEWAVDSGADRLRAVIHNVGTESGSLVGYWLCQRPSHQEIPDIELAPRESVAISLGGDAFLPPPGAFTIDAQLNLGGLSASSGEIGLYSSNAFGSADATASYVEWGDGGHGRSGTAVDAGIWTDGGFVVTDDGTAFIQTGTLTDFGSAEVWETP